MASGRPFRVGRMPTGPGSMPSGPPLRPPTTGRRANPPEVRRVVSSMGRFVKSTPGSAFGFAWEGLDVMQENIAASGMRYWRGMVEEAEDVARIMQDYAAEHAPWQNRTWAARQSLRAVVVPESEGRITIFLGHGVFYGVYLETYLGLPIIMPTILHFAPVLMGRATMERAWTGRAVAERVRMGEEE